MNYYHEKYGDELVVIAINETDKEALEKMEGPTKIPKTISMRIAQKASRKLRKTARIPHTINSPCQALLDKSVSRWFM